MTDDLICELTELGSPYYNQAVQLRYDAFFKDTATPISALHDEYENRSVHVVALDAARRDLQGYGRLTLLADREAQISQLVVVPERRGDQRIWRELAFFMRDYALKAGVVRIIADVRVRGVPLFSKVGLRAIGAPFPSRKTQIMHQRMEWNVQARADCE